jgi:diguanylate cyclase (GGDEF)-like protein/PAS domain S-box-containing protein
MTTPADLPPDEPLRLASLRDLLVLDTPPEPLFDALTQMASQQCGTEVALISLVDVHRQWFKSCVGLPGVEETDRSVAFCAHAILGAGIMEVPDALADERFRHNPLVTGEPHIRFYAGAPLLLRNGACVGTLCVIDRAPRQLNEQQRATLQQLAHTAAEALQLRANLLHANEDTRHSLEQVLLEREARYRAIVEDQTELISLAHPNGVLTFVNTAYARWFGSTPEKMIGQNFLLHVPPEEREQVKAHLSKVVEADGPVIGENTSMRPDGERCWMTWTNRCLRDAQGRILGIHSVGRDTTERKRVEESLRRSEARLRSLYEATPAMLQSIDAHGRLLTVSDTWLRKLGYTRAAVIGRPFTEFMPITSQRLFLDVLERRLHDQGHSQGELQLKRADGGIIEVTISSILERDINGQALRALSVLEDVTEKHRMEAELRANQERLALATQANGIGIWELDVPSGRLTWNPMMFDIFGIEPSSFTGGLRDWHDRVHPDDRAFARKEFEAALAGHRSLDFDFRVVLPGGQLRSVMARATVFRDAQGQATRVLGVNYDITDRKAMERELAEKHELLRVTLHSIGDAVITTDAQGRVQWLNPVAERMTGWHTEAARGLLLEQVFHIVNEHTREAEPSPVNRCLHDPDYAGQIDQTLLISRDGQEYGIEDSASAIRDDAGQVLGVVLVFHDVTEQRRMGHEMRFRASHDELTGLINRTEFDRLLSQALHGAQQHEQQHALMYIDLDQFKLVNDACGHAVGDQLLCQVTQLLQTCVRNSDTLARLGGDEFGVILSRCTVEQALRVAQSICDQMEEFRFTHEGRRFRIGASIGLVPVDRRWNTSAAVMQAADSACYAAKEAGRNRVHAWFDTDEALRARRGEMQWANRLEQALDDNRFVLFAQRIAPVKAKHKGLHCEVLLRLQDDEGKLIPPGAFLPAAERFHMGPRIDRWVVRHTLLALEQCGEALDTVDTIAINLSGQSVADPAFQQHLNDLLDQTTVDVRKLCLEVTETAAITKLQDAAGFIAAVRERGVRVALDDFGAGASSYGYLKALPVDYLKIDGQFIKNLVHDPLDQAAVRSFCDVARVLGLRTIAEFVEDEATLSALRSLGVDHAQGYLVHRPEPLDAVLSSQAADTMCG